MAHHFASIVVQLVIWQECLFVLLPNYFPFIGYIYKNIIFRFATQLQLIFHIFISHYFRIVANVNGFSIVYYNILHESVSSHYPLLMQQLSNYYVLFLHISYYHILLKYLKLMYYGTERNKICIHSYHYFSLRKDELS